MCSTSSTQQTKKTPYELIPLRNFDPSLGVMRNHKEHIPMLIQVGQLGCQRVRNRTYFLTETSELPRILEFGRGKAKYSIETKPRTVFSSGFTQKVSLVIPIQGNSYGETFGSAVYMGFVAFRAILEMTNASPANVSVILLDDASVASESNKKASEDTHADTTRKSRLCVYAANKARPYRPGFWPVGDVMSDGVAMEKDHEWKNFTDGTRHLVNFSSILSSCANAKSASSWIQKRRSFVLEAVQAWGVGEILDWSDRSDPWRTELGYILDAQLLKGWFREDSAQPVHLQHMITSMHKYYFGRLPTANTQIRQKVVIASRPLKYNAVDSCCICKRLWVNEAEVADFLLGYTGLEVQVVDFDDLSLKETMEVMDTARLFIGLHGSALWNVLFMYHSGASVEFWPRGYFEAKYYNQPRFVGVTYLYDEVEEGNWEGHNSWSIVSTRQLVKLVDLALNITEIKSKKLVKVSPLTASSMRRR
jgi:hypothetical protein